MDFQIVIDDREKTPYGFDCCTMTGRLEAGDYSVAGFESAVIRPNGRVD